MLVVLAGLATGAHCQGDYDGPNANRVLWHVAGDALGLPAFDTSAAYFPGFHHDVVAVDKSSGTVRWQIRLPYVPTCTPADSITVGFASTVSSGSVVVMDDGLYALDPATGALRWSFHPPQGCILAASWPGSDAQSIYAGADYGSVYAIDAATGSVRWRSQFIQSPSVVAFSPVVDNGTVYAEFNVEVPTAPYDSGGVVALDAATGSVRWTRWFPRTRANLPPRGLLRVAVTASTVVAPSQDGLIYGLDRSDGSVRWTAPRVDTLHLDDRWVAASGLRAIAGSNTGLVVAYDGSTGTELWRSDNVGSVVRLTADGQVVFANLGFTTIVALDPANGRMRWRFGGGNGTAHEALTPAAADSDRVYLGTTDGYYAIRKN
jgi:outer membrane protein assembly factor BamB